MPCECARIITEKSGAAEKPAEKEQKAKRQRKPKTDIENNGRQPFINPYGFIHLSKDVQEKFGVQKGKKTPISIEVQGDALIIKKIHQ